MSRRQPKCRSCQRPVVFFRSPFAGKPCPFDPTPVEPSHPAAGVKAFPVLGGVQAYRPNELAAHLMVQRESSRTEAEDEVRDLPWHLIHTCRPDTPVQED